MHSSMSTRNVKQHIGPDLIEQVRMYTIGEVSKITGLSVQMVRYYGKVGLLKPADFTNGGHRLYTTEEIWRLELILTLRYLGFAVNEVSKIISGEVLISNALDWQIEALQTQICNCSSMISILESAKESVKENDFGEESLRHVHDLVESISNSSEERKRFIYEKMTAPLIPDQVPYEVKHIQMRLINLFFPPGGKLSPKQAIAWKELEKLLDDPEHISEEKRILESFLSKIEQSSVDVAALYKRLEWIYEQMDEAVEQQMLPDSPLVQKLVREFVLCFENPADLPYTTQEFRTYVKAMSRSKTERIVRLWELIMILQPNLKTRIKSFILLFQGLEWMKEHLEVE